MNIPFVDLQSQYQTLKEEVDAAVLAVMQRGDFVLGGAVAEFERIFACLLYTSPSPRDRTRSRMPSSA